MAQWVSAFYTMHFINFALAFYPNVNAMQMQGKEFYLYYTLIFLFYFGKFRVVYKEYENIFSKFEHHICKKIT